MLKIHLKNEIKEQYGKFAIDGNPNSCCMPSSDCCGISEVLLSPFESSKIVGYDSDKLKLIPESSILGVGCGNPARSAGFDEGNTVIDLGSGPRVDVFLAANLVKEIGKVIGIDMTENTDQKR